VLTGSSPQVKQKVTRLDAPAASDLVGMDSAPMLADGLLGVAAHGATAFRRARYARFAAVCRAVSVA
jgi:hypothetical protein